MFSELLLAETNFVNSSNLDCNFACKLICSFSVEFFICFCKSSISVFNLFVGLSFTSIAKNSCGISLSRREIMFSSCAHFAFAFSSASISSNFTELSIIISFLCLGLNKIIETITISVQNQLVNI